MELEGRSLFIGIMLSYLLIAAFFIGTQYDDAPHVIVKTIEVPKPVDVEVTIDTTQSDIVRINGRPILEEP